MRRSVLLALTALLCGAPALAQEPGSPQPQTFRIEWARLPPTMRPGVEGYVSNDARWRVTNVRLRVQVKDGSGRVVRERAAAVGGNRVPHRRARVELPPPPRPEADERARTSLDHSSHRC